MSGKEVWFRTGDGRELVCNEGSAEFGLMSKDGSFTRIDGPGAAETASFPDGPDLSKMKKAELLEYAAERGIEVSPKATAAAIIEVIKAAESEQEA